MKSKQSIFLSHVTETNAVNKCVYWTIYFGVFFWLFLQAGLTWIPCTLEIQQNLYYPSVSLLHQYEIFNQNGSYIVLRVVKINIKTWILQPRTFKLLQALLLSHWGVLPWLWRFTNKMFIQALPVFQSQIQYKHANKKNWQSSKKGEGDWGVSTDLQRVESSLINPIAF